MLPISPLPLVAEQCRQLPVAYVTPIHCLDTIKMDAILLPDVVDDLKPIQANIAAMLNMVDNLAGATSLAAKDLQAAKASREKQVQKAKKDEEKKRQVEAVKAAKARAKTKRRVLSFLTVLNTNMTYMCYALTQK